MRIRVTDSKIAAHGGTSLSKNMGRAYLKREKTRVRKTSNIFLVKIHIEPCNLLPWQQSFQSKEYIAEDADSSPQEIFWLQKAENKQQITVKTKSHTR